MTNKTSERKLNNNKSQKTESEVIENESEYASIHSGTIINDTEIVSIEHISKKSSKIKNINNYNNNKSKNILNIPKPVKINNIIYKRNNNYGIFNSINENIINKISVKNSINNNNNNNVNHNVINNNFKYNDKIIVPQVKIKKKNKDDNCIII